MLKRIFYWLIGPRPKWVGGGFQPTNGSADAAGFDLYATEGAVIGPGEVRLIDLNIRACFNPFWVALLWDRSGMGAKGIHRFGGVIDADYRGNWKVCLYNTTHNIWTINRGDRIAQVIFQPIWTGAWSKTDKLPETDRGDKGYGSTGR